MEIYLFGVVLVFCGCCVGVLVLCCGLVEEVH